jgi:RNA polymerase sigma-70 factor (ECF subfamily)
MLGTRLEFGTPMAKCESTTLPAAIYMSDHRTDAELLLAIAQNRDSVAFNELFARHQDRCYSLAYHILQNAALAEDAVQEAMLALWQSPKCNRPDDNLQAWILGIIAGKCMNARRGRKRQSRREQAVCRDVVSKADTSDQAERSETLEQLRRHLKELPELDSQLLACCFGANLSHQKISEMLGIPRRTITGRIQQALGELRGRLLSSGITALALAPLLSAESIHQAFTTGQTCPPLQIAPAPASTSRLHRIHPRARPFNAGFVLAAIAVAAAVVGAVMMKGNPQPSVPPVSQPDKATPVVNAAPLATPKLPIATPTINRRWDFKTRPESLDIQCITGNWEWNSMPKGGAMGSRDGQNVVVVLPVEIQHQNVKLTLTLVGFETKCNVFTSWLDGAKIVDFSYWHQTTNFVAVRQALTTKVVFTRNECLQWMDGHLNTHRTYNVDWPGDHLILQFTDTAVESIALQSISDEEAGLEFKNAASDIRMLHGEDKLQYKAQALPPNAQR